MINNQAYALQFANPVYLQSVQAPQIPVAATLTQPVPYL